MPSISFARDSVPLRNRAFLKLPLRPRIEIFDMLLAGYLLSKPRRNRTTDVEYSNLVDSMHAKCRHRSCGRQNCFDLFPGCQAKQIFLYEAVAAVGQDACRVAMRHAKGARAERWAAVTPPWLASASRFRLR